jgi:hypothetical protein
LDFDKSSSLNQQSVGRHVAPLKTYYPDSEPTSHCSYFLILHAYQRSNKYQSYIFFAFQPDLRSNPRSAANKASMLSITSPMRLTPIKISQGLLRDKQITGLIVLTFSLLSCEGYYHISLHQKLLLTLSTC